MLALAAPALGLRLATPGPDTYPSSLEVVKTYERMQQAFPGSALPATVVVKAPDVNAPEVRAAIERLREQALASGRAFDPITVEVNADATVARIDVPIAGEGTDAASVSSLAELRETIVPETVGALPDAETGVTGLTAAWADQADELESKLPPVVAFVLLFAFCLMLVAFRSVVVAAKAILLNLLSVGAAYGVLVLVFQHGVGKGLLGFSSTAGIDPVVPLLLFVTAGVVTSAATVMVLVFGVFATLSMLFFKQFGVGLAAAILIDATIVRAVLLPAAMKLLGERNWYLPRWLEWLPRLEGHAPEALPAAEPEPARAA